MFLKNENISAENVDNVEYMIRKYIKKVIMFSRKQYDRLNRFITVHEELAFDEIDEINDKFYDQSIDCIMDSISFKESTDVDYNHLENIFANERLHNIVKELTLKQKQLLFLKFIKDMTDQKIADNLGISRQGVGKIKNSAIRRIINEYVKLQK